jgi:hypothetical protein
VRWISCFRGRFLLESSPSIRSMKMRSLPTELKDRFHSRFFLFHFQWVEQPLQVYMGVTYVQFQSVNVTLTVCYFRRVYCLLLAATHWNIITKMRNWLLCPWFLLSLILRRNSISTMVCFNVGRRDSILREWRARMLFLHLRRVWVSTALLLMRGNLFRVRNLEI